MISLKTKSFLTGAVLTAGIAIAGGANAATFLFAETNTQTSTSVDLSASLSFTLNNVVGNEYFYDVTLSNTTAPQDGNNVLSNWGINVNPDGVTLGSATGLGVYTPGGIGNPGQQLGNFEFCWESFDNNNCNGGNANAALGEGESVSGTLSFISSGELEFINAYVRYQQVGAGSAGSEFTGSTPECDPLTEICDPPVSQVPLPAGMMLMLSALGVGGIIARRRSA